jgi:hypothetical protein
MIFENKLEKEMMDATCAYLEKRLELANKSEDFELMMFYMSITKPEKYGRAWINYCKNGQRWQGDGRE